MEVANAVDLTEVSDALYKVTGGCVETTVNVLVDMLVAIKLASSTWDDDDQWSEEVMETIKSRLRDIRAMPTAYGRGH